LSNFYSKNKNRTKNIIQAGRTTIRNQQKVKRF
jgi:hypothetical protein